MGGVGPNEVVRSSEMALIGPDLVLHVMQKVKAHKGRLKMA